MRSSFAPRVPPAATALGGLRPSIGAVPLENISSLARAGLGNPDIIPLWFGEGDLPAPAFVGEAMARAVAEGQVFYTYQNGVPALREALSDYLTGLGSTPNPVERITVTTSGMNAIQLALQLTLGPEDSLLVIDPVWPNAAGMAGLIGAGVRRVRMDFGDDGWTLDLAKVARAMDGTVKAVVFASPGNPTGAMVPIEVQRGLLELCRARGIWLIADEVYNRLVFGRRAAPTLLDHADADDRLFVVNSFSKSWAMTGWRLGWLVHPPSVGPTLAMAVQYTTSGTATFVQHAGVAALRQGEPFVALVRDYCQRGMGIVCDALERLPRVRLGPRPRAGMYAFFEVEGLTDTRAACVRIVREAGVGLAPGVFFGPGSETFFRLCVAREPASLAEAMARLERVFG
ncbi:MAG: pyridoxal phosphate-dependent aminotransferase [Caulobacteraceae bacterium]|nr:pyridoxal phosphate-dependent aminotransferase [Caulobacteraceae bacterium]